jgi:glucose-6-phosphate 1-dehydrogenase
MYSKKDKTMKTQLVIFGITGDLAGRKLLPALKEIIGTGEYDDLSIVGVSRREVDTSQLLAAQPELIKRTSVYTMDLADVAAYDGLKQSLDAAQADQTLFYLSVPPGAAADIVDFLGEAGLNTPQYKVLFEKPFGYDLISAQEFIERTARYFQEEQLYRIDHYMAKEVAAQLLQLRRNAENHHHSWNNQSIRRVTVVASEKIGIEGRAQFYEQTGALRDFIQGHLLQLLSLVLINKPGAKALPAERLEVLKQIKPADPSKATRAQYEGYQEEVENPGSPVETFASLELESTDPAWEGVELRLITGKALNEKRSYIQIDYSDGKSDVFEEGKFLTQDARALDAYERVLIEAIAGRKEIFTTSPEVLRAWEIVAPVQEAWSMSREALETYSVGSLRI